MSSISQQYVAIWRANVRDWHALPTPLQSAAYMVTEAAEVLDAVLRLEEPDHDRTNGHAAKAGLEREIGQTLEMLLTTANHYGIDAHCAMYAWMGEVEDRNPAKQAAKNGSTTQNTPAG